MTLSPLWNRDKESEKYLLELGIVGSLSDSVSQRDFSVSKKANLVNSCLKEEQKNNICWFLFQRTTANVDPTFRFPSAVNRRRLQVPQNCSDIEVMNPTWARFEDHHLTYEIKEPDLAQKAGYFPPLRRVVWSVFHPLERGERLPDDLQHLLRVKVRSDTLSCNCAELDRPDRAPSFPCSNGCRRKACTRWNGHRCCWKKRNCLCIWIPFLVRVILRWRVIDSLVPGFLNKIDDLVFVQAPHDHTVHLATLVTRRILSCRFEKLLWTK